MTEIRHAVVDPPAQTVAPTRPLPLNLLRLARPSQWAKSVFVLAGPVYFLADAGLEAGGRVIVPALIAAGAFALASSACYVINDLLDVERDRMHPRKRTRPIARGEVSQAQALWFAAALLAAAIGLVLLIPGPERTWLALSVSVYVANVMVYSFVLKRVVIADVIGLSVGFVLRVLGGCAAVGVEPSSWLLNCTFFLAMFLAFGKRLGERRTMGENAADARAVQSMYTDELLRMAVVVNAVAALLTYSAYVQDRAAGFTLGFNLLWLTVLPATYCLLRCIVLLEKGVYDDPTELAARDRPFQVGLALFVALTVVLVVQPGFELGAGGAASL
ncbi:MAG: UbiA family prenyltransferase [Planctomycetes bacterium]|nr:UbiA family prenyltransferase [Planctomycetota bacterium]